MFQALLITGLLIVSGSQAHAIEVPRDGAGIARTPWVAKLNRQSLASRSWLGFNAQVPKAEDFTNLKALSAGWARVNFSWSLLEPYPPGHPQADQNWSNPQSLRRKEFDLIVETAAKTGINLVVILGHTPTWATPASIADLPEPWRLPPRDEKEFAAHIRAVVSAYKDRGVKHWMIWNEPNLPNNFDADGICPDWWVRHKLSLTPDSEFSAAQKSDACQYYSLHHYIHHVHIPGAKAIRETDPAARIVGPELAGTIYGEVLNTRSNWYAWLRDIMLTAGKDYVDIVGQHEYDLPSTLFDSQFPKLKNHLSYLGFGQKPIWITETGWSSGHDILGQITRTRDGKTGQAALYRDFLVRFRKHSGISKVFFFELNDPEVGPTDYKFGIVEKDGTQKPAFQSILCTLLRFPRCPNL